MPVLTPLLSIAALWAVAVVTPGPNFLVTARLAVGQGRRWLDRLAGTMFVLLGVKLVWSR